MTAEHEMIEDHFSIVCALFTDMDNKGVWDEAAFNAWCLNANSTAWGVLEPAWRYAGSTPLLTWKIVKNAVLEQSARVGTAPLTVLGIFLYTDDWFSNQTLELKQDIFMTAQHWIMQSTVDMEFQSWVLLNIAFDSGFMKEWRQMPSLYRQSIEWHAGMFTLNTFGTDLTIEDIQAMPKKYAHQTLGGIMAKCYDYENSGVAKYIETYAGPGIWLEYVLEGTHSDIKDATELAHKYMQQPNSLESWAIEQYITPAASFDTSLAGAEHREWAYRWWLGCARDGTQHVDE